MTRHIWKLYKIDRAGKCIKEILHNKFAECHKKYNSWVCDPKCHLPYQLRKNVPCPTTGPKKAELDLQGIFGIFWLPSNKSTYLLDTSWYIDTSIFLKMHRFVLYGYTMYRVCKKMTFFLCLIFILLQYTIQYAQK